MKIRGLKKLKRRDSPQVTFAGDKHPTCGAVCGMSWNDLKVAFENAMPKSNRREVVSIKVTERGLDFYQTGVVSVGEGMSIYRKFTGQED